MHLNYKLWELPTGHLSVLICQLLGTDKMGNSDTRRIGESIFRIKTYRESTHSISILATTEYKRLSMWYGHLQRAGDKRWSKQIIN